MSNTQPEAAGRTLPEATPEEAVDERARTERPPPSEVAPASAVVRGGAAADREAEPRDRVGQVLAGRYRIEAELGAGGMGTVYRAEHVHMRKTLAVKVLHREMTYLPEVVARFEREAVAAARIEHPHVAAATDFGQLDDGSFYLVLEFVEGRSLGDLISKTGPLAPPIALHIARQIAEGLAAAHAAGIVHRDLKPDNVMLISRDGDDHFVKVLDFGIAKIETGDAQNPLTQLGSVFGTPEYMAPEQAAGTPVDARADLYTLGIIMYEMLSGKTPFAGEDLVAVLMRQMTMEPPPLPASLDPAVRSLVMRLLEKDPERRFQAATELVASIEGMEASVASAPASMAMTPSPTSVTLQSAIASEPLGAAHAATVLSLPSAELVRRQAAPSLPGLRNPTVEAALERLRQPVSLGAHRVPLWSILVAGLSVAFLLFMIFGVVLAAGVSAGDSPATAAGSAATRGAVRSASSKEDPELEKKAASGDRTALAKLQERPESQRSAGQWRALGRGQTVVGNLGAGLQAYGKALVLDPSLAKDREIVADVHRAAQNPQHAREALKLAATSLGSTGADLVYDVWTRTRGDKESQDVARLAKEQLDGSGVRSKASPALLVALDLAKARTCPEYKEILPRAERVGDARSQTKLKSLSARSGCGFLGFGDCYGCLRSGKQLENAIKAASERPPPKF